MQQRIADLCLARDGLPVRMFWHFCVQPFGARRRVAREFRELLRVRGVRINRVLMPINHALEIFNCGLQLIPLEHVLRIRRSQRRRGLAILPIELVPQLLHLGPQIINRRGVLFSHRFLFQALELRWTRPKRRPSV